MFVAWMQRLFPLLLLVLALQASARDDSLFTSSVTYCSEPDALLIQQFDVAYFRVNNSIWFNISAASVEPNVSVSANIMLNVYGMHPVNSTLDLCSLFNGALCPLPTYNFTGSDSIVLPSSLGVSNKIPGIAFQIPDLEAYAQLTLTDVTTGELKACVQATLSNGWSAHQAAVEWVTGALALLALLSAIWHSRSSDTLAPHRLLDLLYLFQWAASTALLDLNYSSVYIAFATNFSWALGLFPASATSAIQLSINNMRHLTGGSMEDATSGSAVAFVNRELSPYNSVVTSASYQQMNLARRTLATFGNLMVPGSALPAFPRSVQELVSDGTVQLVTATSSNVLQAGVPIYVEYVGIATANAFMTIFLVALMLFAILVAALGIGYCIVTLASRKNASLLPRRELYPAFACGWLLRVCLVAATPIGIFALYQWTLKDSWLSVLLSVVLFLGVFGYLSFSVFRVVRLATRATPFVLYTQPKTITSYGPLFALYRPERYFAGIPFLISILVKAMFIAFAHAKGEVQVIFILVVECMIFAYLLFLKPHRTRGADILATYLALTRVVCTGLLVAFVQNFNVAAIPRVVISIVTAIIISVAVIIMFINTLINLDMIKVPARFRRRKAPSFDASTLEKGDNEQDKMERPRNPTPERNIPLDPNVNQPYPETLETSSEIATEESSYSEESDSTTLGSLLPRRWSLQPSSGTHSRPSSQSQYSSTRASSPRYSHPPSPLYTQSALHSRPPTIDEHGPIAF